jgi:6-phosphogluconolactonase
MNLSKNIKWGRHPLAGFLLVAALASGQVQAQEKYLVYFGTYTGKVSKGIYQCEMNLKDGSLSAATLAGETSSPSFLAFHPNKKFLWDLGLVRSFDRWSPSRHP